MLLAEVTLGVGTPDLCTGSSAWFVHGEWDYHPGQGKAPAGDPDSLADTLVGK